MRRYGMTSLLLTCVLAFSASTAASASAAGSPGAAAWGANASGQLGDGTTTNSLDPAPVSGLSSVVSLAGDKDHTLALLSSGKVLAWGTNANGQLGDGSLTASDVPVEVKGISTAIAVAAGGESASRCSPTAASSHGARTRKDSWATAASRAPTCRSPSTTSAK